ncbi:hypothetical protein P1X14_00155 [Sphingomonas sp. AOB5]|uniref:hypothetical protein n=1 Tax=Sphingomonas sp. AOB5 TaxID=3034017 RepID=UPI0023F7197D|nr:hypothetical protein [Sphingomonas sp. AOB5]MDF7773643.1 hypothetical protein [Sphingomonas sp. AOB5]
MTTEQDGEYYERRARQERERAERTGNAAVQKVHRQLADAYERRIEDSGTSG